MGHYKSNVRDLEFNLLEVLDLEKVLATGEFGDLDGETVREMLSEASRLAQGVPSSSVYSRTYWSCPNMPYMLDAPAPLTAALKRVSLAMTALVRMAP